jgi:hypothetical protein
MALETLFATVVLVAAASFALRVRPKPRRVTVPVRASRTRP